MLATIGLLCVSIPVVITGIVLVKEGSSYCEHQLFAGLLLIPGGLAGAILAILTLTGVG